MFSGYPSKVCSFLNGEREDQNWRERRYEERNRSGRRGSCGWDALKTKRKMEKRKGKILKKSNYFQKTIFLTVLVKGCDTHQVFIKLCGLGQVSKVLFFNLYIVRIIVNR